MILRLTSRALSTLLHTWAVCLILASLFSLFLLQTTLRWARLSLRWCAWPLPSRWRHKRAVWDALRARKLAPTEEAWHAAAARVDDLEGATAWRAVDDDRDYDSKLLEETRRQLRHARLQRDVNKLLSLLAGVMSRSYAGVDSPDLFARSYVGTKHLIHDYLEEVCACLTAVGGGGADGGPPLEERLKFFETCRTSLGRTALLLSGGGALAMAHIGVVTTLLRQGLLPRIISGASGGALVAALLATRTDAELLALGSDPGHIINRGLVFFPPWRTQLARFAAAWWRSWFSDEKPYLVDAADFSAAVRAIAGDESFAEAFARTGRIVSISVSRTHTGAAGGLPRPLLLNYLATPNVLIWSAAAASCALPGVIPPFTLLSRTPSDGCVRPFHVPGVLTLDGSVANDLPWRELGVMFHVDRFIAVQTNPHISPFIASRHHAASSRSTIDSNAFSRLLSAGELFCATQVTAHARFLAEIDLLPWFYGTDLSRILVQRYDGDVTIVPHASKRSAWWRAFSQPDSLDMEQYALEGCRATWKHLTHIHALLCVERTLSRMVRQTRERMGGGGGMLRSESFAVPADGTGGLLSSPVHEAAKSSGWDLGER